MKRLLLPVLVIAICVVTSAGLLLAGALGVFGAGPLYSVAELQAALARHPASWDGRTLQVRGMAVMAWGSPCMISCTAQGGDTFYMQLQDPAADSSLPIEAAPAESWSGGLRQLPLIGQLLPQQQARWGSIATYRVQLRAQSPQPASGPSYHVVLLDAAPLDRRPIVMGLIIRPTFAPQQPAPATPTPSR